MIGVVLLGPASNERVLGMSVAMRALLSLQAAAVDRVLLIGEAGPWLALTAATDDRVRVRIEAAEGWPEGDAIVIAQGVVIDAKAAKSLAAMGEGKVTREGALLAARTHRAGKAEGDAASGLPEISPSGVIASARDARGVAEASRALLDSLRKPQDGWVSRAINRHISLAITRLLVWTPVRPNPLSLVILGIGLWGAYLASRGTHAQLALGGVLFQLQSILDGCDGELSRLTFRGSKRGEWLDTIGDDVTNYSFFLGAAIGLRAMGVSAALLLGVAGVVIGVITSGIEYRYLISIGSGDLLKYPLGFGNDPEPSSEPQGVVARVLGAIRPAFKRDFFVFLTMLAAIAGKYPMLVMLGLFTAGAAATFGAVLASEARRARYST